MTPSDGASSTFSATSAGGETLVGGAPISTQLLNTALTWAPNLAAADSGADTILREGLRPARVVGDLDSISDAARTAFKDVITHIAEQDSTDFAKALRTGTAPFYIAVGFIGAQVDHFLACLTEMARRHDANCAPVILLSDADCVCILPRRARLDLPTGTRLSLWPMAKATGTSAGLEWPIDGLTLDPTLQVGTSNRSVAPDVAIDMDGGPVALILPAKCLPQMLNMLEIASRTAGAGDV